MYGASAQNSTHSSCARYQTTASARTKCVREFHATSVSSTPRLKSATRAKTPGPPLQRAAGKLYNRCSVPGWRNWQTRRTQNPVPAREWGFDSLPRHQIKNLSSKDLGLRPKRRAYFFPFSSISHLYPIASAMQRIYEKTCGQNLVERRKKRLFDLRSSR